MGKTKLDLAGDTEQYFPITEIFIWTKKSNKWPFKTYIKRGGVSDECFLGSSAHLVADNALECRLCNKRTISHNIKMHWSNLDSASAMFDHAWMHYS